MIAMLTAATVAFAVAIFGTAYAIRLFRAWNIGQFIQQELEGHMHKSGTPTMGGIVIIAAILCGYTVSQFRIRFDDQGIDLVGTGFEASGLLVIGAIVGMGVVGFIDDYQKLSRFRNKGLGITAKLIGQLAVAGLFTWGAVVAGASTALAFTRPTALDLGAAAFAVWVLLLLTGFANAVNFTDGLDGLASGSVALVAASYMIIAFWIFRHPEIYQVEGSLGLATVASALMGASLGFLWWNACPARIIMGDVGSQALGGGITAIALLTNTHLLLVILGGLFVIEGPVGHNPGGGIPVVRRATGVPDGAHPSSLRDEGMAGDHHHHPFLDHRRHRRGARSRDLLRGLPGRGPGGGILMRALVLGAGISGKAASRLLTRLGMEHRIYDRSADALKDPPAGVETAGGEWDRSMLAGVSLVVASPGFMPHLVPLTDARAAGIPIWSEVELAVRHLDCPVIAVTGTNGKTTVCRQTTEMLAESGIRAVAAGNIGVPISDVRLGKLRRGGPRDLQLPAPLHLLPGAARLGVHERRGRPCGLASVPDRVPAGQGSYLPPSHRQGSAGLRHGGSGRGRPCVGSSRPQGAGDWFRTRPWAGGPLRAFRRRPDAPRRRGSHPGDA